MTKHPRKVAIAGLGYVGTAYGSLLSMTCDVIGYDPDFDAMARAPFSATIVPWAAYRQAHWVVVCVPTDWDDTTGTFDTSVVASVLREVREYNKNAWIVIKSTVPVGFTDQIHRTDPKVIVSPEFLREDHHYEDVENPSRVVVGAGPAQLRAARRWCRLLEAARDFLTDDPHTPEYIMEPAQAEAVKLAANAYLATRVAFFNEVDALCAAQGVQTGPVVEAICTDPRIGGGYNNPSFGFGGYCLPKDARQFAHELSARGVDSSLASAVTAANKSRAMWAALHATRRANDGVVGIYRLAMKQGSDNWRASAMLEVIAALNVLGARVVVYEPLLQDTEFMGCPVVSFDQLSTAAVIVANRWDDQLEPHAEKVFTRDVFHRD